MNIHYIYTILLIALFVSPSFGKIESHTKTDQRSVQFNWSDCDGCVCKYMNLYGFEYDVKYLSSYGSDYDDYYFYFGISEYNSCESTFTSSVLYKYDKVEELWISPSSRNAKITNLDGLVDSKGNDVSINLEWNDSSRGYQCNCREEQQYGVLGYKFNTKSRSTSSDVSGTVVVGDQTYEIDGSDNGYVYSSGYKSLITTHQ